MSECTGWYELTFESEAAADLFFRGLDGSDEEALGSIGLDEAWLDLALGGGEVTVEYAESSETIRVFVELDTRSFEEAIRDLVKRVAVHGCCIDYHSGAGAYSFCSIEDGAVRGHYATSREGKFDELFYENDGWTCLAKCKALWKADEFARDEGYQRAMEEYRKLLDL
jgi:hypothetical protein